MSSTAARLLLPALFGVGAVLMSGERSPSGGASKRVLRFVYQSSSSVEAGRFFQEWARAVPNLELLPVLNGPPRFSQLQDGEADLAIDGSLAASRAFWGRYDTSGKRFDRLRAIATLGIVPVQLVAQENSGIESIVDLRGRVVSLGPYGSETSRAAVTLLNAAGLEYRSVVDKALLPAAAATQLRDGRIKAFFVASPYLSEAVRVAISDSHAYLVPLDGRPVNQLVVRWLYRIIIPPGTYEGQSAAIRTVGLKTLILCRQDLDEEIVYELTGQFFAALPRLAAIAGSLRRLDLTQAPATAIPLHEGAARYYRERELLR